MMRWFLESAPAESPEELAEKNKKQIGMLVCQINQEQRRHIRHADAFHNEAVKAASNGASDEDLLKITMKEASAREEAERYEPYKQRFETMERIVTRAAVTQGLNQGVSNLAELLSDMNESFDVSDAVQSAESLQDNLAAFDKKAAAAEKALDSATTIRPEAQAAARLKAEKLATAVRLEVNAKMPSVKAGAVDPRKEEMQRDAERLHAKSDPELSDLDRRLKALIA
jgi:hypothetical protein